MPRPDLRAFLCCVEHPQSEPLHLELLAGIAEHGEAFLQEVAEQRHAKKVACSTFIVGPGRFLADDRPVAGGCSHVFGLLARFA
jgi:hypothetical protein